MAAEAVPGRMAVREAQDLLSQRTQQQVWAVIAAAGPLQGLSLAPPPESRAMQAGASNPCYRTSGCSSSSSSTNNHR
jgi:hypothetical protein